MGSVSKKINSESNLTKFLNEDYIQCLRFHQVLIFPRTDHRYFFPQAPTCTCLLVRSWTGGRLTMVSGSPTRTSLLLSVRSMLFVWLTLLYGLRVILPNTMFHFILCKIMLTSQLSGIFLYLFVFAMFRHCHLYLPFLTLYELFLTHEILTFVVGWNLCWRSIFYSWKHIT